MTRTLVSLSVLVACALALTGCSGAARPPAAESTEPVASPVLSQVATPFPAPDASATSEFRVLQNTSPGDEPAQRARICDQLLAGENQHDGSLWLAGHGDRTCVPALMRVLRDNRPDPDSDISVCTYDHAVVALKTSSGDYTDRTYAEWVEWYTGFEDRQSSD